MGFILRKRNPKGLNLSVSKNGVRVSKTFKMGNFTYNIGHTFNSDNTGKTTGRATINFGNGLRYQKHKTFSSSSKPSLPNITAETLEASIYQTPEYTNKEKTALGEVWDNISGFILTPLWILNPVIGAALIYYLFYVWGIFGFERTINFSSNIHYIQHYVNTLFMSVYYIILTALTIRYIKDNSPGIDILARIGIVIYFITTLLYLFYAIPYVTYELITKQ